MQFCVQAFSLAVLAAALVAGGCGQKGDLYLPGEARAGAPAHALAAARPDPRPPAR